MGIHVATASRHEGLRLVADLSEERAPVGSVRAHPSSRSRRVLQQPHSRCDVDVRNCSCDTRLGGWVGRIFGVPQAVEKHTDYCVLSRNSYYCTHAEHCASLTHSTRANVQKCSGGGRGRASSVSWRHPTCASRSYQFPSFEGTMLLHRATHEAPSCLLSSRTHSPTLVSPSFGRYSCCCPSSCSLLAAIKRLAGHRA